MEAAQLTTSPVCSVEMERLGCAGKVGDHSHEEGNLGKSALEGTLETAELIFSVCVFKCFIATEYIKQVTMRLLWLEKMRGPQSMVLCAPASPSLSLPSHSYPCQSLTRL